MPPSKQDIYGVNITTGKYKNKSELINYLKELHTNLHGLSQELADRPKGLQNIALQLIEPKILNNSDKDVRLLTSCCIVDLLRIYAPEVQHQKIVLLQTMLLGDPNPTNVHLISQFVLTGSIFGRKDGGRVRLGHRPIKRLVYIRSYVRNKRESSVHSC